MRRKLLVMIVAVVAIGTIGCGGYNREPSIKPGAPTTQNTVDPPDMTTMRAKAK